MTRSLLHAGYADDRVTSTSSSATDALIVTDPG
jgi:hypothetical protein